MSESRVSTWRLLVLAWIIPCALTGCQSTQFGDLLTPVEAPSQARAILGAPTSSENRVTQASHQEPSHETATRIDLTTALQLAGVQNPTIAIADEAVQARLAERMQARALLFPHLDAGGNLRMHRGNFLTASGNVVERSIQSLYYGFGADTKGAGTIAVPGIRLVSHLGDACFAPQAAQERVVAGRFDAMNTNNYVLMEVGIRYLTLAEAEARLAAFQQSEKEIAEIERVTASFAKAGQGRDSDAKRAQAEASLVRAEIERMREDIGVAAAELARLLDVDPGQNLRVSDIVAPILESVDLSASLEALLGEALANHPELVARSADLASQETRLRQERVRPFLPTIFVGFSAGAFGGGSHESVPRLRDFGARTDFDVAAVWSLQGLGVGYRAVRGTVCANVEIAYLELSRSIDRVRREVAEAHATALARRQEVEIAKKRVEMARRAYMADLTRTKNLQGLPLEVLASAKQLMDARQDLIRATIGYSAAHLRLHVTLGNAPAY